MFITGGDPPVCRDCTIEKERKKKMWWSCDCRLIEEEHHKGKEGVWRLPTTEMGSERWQNVGYNLDVEDWVE